MSFTQKIVHSIYSVILFILLFQPIKPTYIHSTGDFCKRLQQTNPYTKCLFLNNLQWFENVTPLASFEQTIIKNVGWVGKSISCLMHELKCISKRLFFKQGGISIVWIYYNRYFNFKKVHMLVLPSKFPVPYSNICTGFPISKRFFKGQF